MRTPSSNPRTSPSPEDLRAQIRMLERPAPRGRGALSFDLPPIDAHLPDGGLALGALHEIRGEPGGAPGIAAATLFVAGLLARLEGPVLWCETVPDLFPPALAGVGLSPDRVIHVAAGDAGAVLLVMEEGLAKPGLAGVVGELSRLPMLASRRLALAAERSGTLALALRRREEGRIIPIAARTRWRVSPFPAPRGAPLGLPRALWKLELIRCRGAAPAAWVVEASDATGHLGMASLLPNRSAAPAARSRARA